MIRALSLKLTIPFSQKVFKSAPNAVFMAEPEKDYEIFRKKYSLPNFEELDLEFDLHCIDDTRFLLKEIRVKIEEKADNTALMMEEILQPDTKVSNLYESRVFSESEKEQLFRIFRKLMKIKKKAVYLMLANNEKDDAEFIKEALSEWLGIKKELSPFMKKLISAWETESDAKEELSYFG